MKKDNNKHFCKLLVIPSIVVAFILAILLDRSLMLINIYEYSLPFNVVQSNLYDFTILFNLILCFILIWSVKIFFEYYSKYIYIYYFFVLISLFIIGGEVFSIIMISKYNVDLHDNENALNFIFNYTLIGFLYLFLISAFFDSYFKKRSAEKANV